MNALEKVISILGSNSAVSRVCDVSHEAVRKWRKRGRLPRTEFTGETNYASLLEEATKGQVTKAELLRLVPPKKGQEDQRKNPTIAADPVVGGGRTREPVATEGRNEKVAA